MRRAVVVSVGVHAGLIAIFVGWSVGRRLSAPSSGAPAPAVELVEPIAIEISLVTLPDTTPSIAGDSTVGRPIARGANIVATTTTAGGVATGGETSAAIPGERTGTMRMRGQRHDLRLPGDVLERIAGATDQAPTFAPTHLRLEPSGPNGYIIRDAVTAVTVARDGTVRFKDKPDFKIRFGLPFSRADFEDLERRAKQEFVAWVADPYKDQRPIPTDEVPRACMMHDDVCYTGPSNGEGGGLVGGKADITAALHRKFIGDPYASRKLKLLDDTRDARVHIGAKYREEQLDRSAVLAQRNVAALWQATTDPVARRAALFTMWDECVEAEGPAGQAGERARAIIVGWIRGRLPAGSPEAFTVDEIARLDAARSSRQRFAPY